MLQAPCWASASLDLVTGMLVVQLNEADTQYFMSNAAFAQKCSKACVLALLLCSVQYQAEMSFSTPSMVMVSKRAFN